MMFGVTQKGEKADAVVNAVMSTLQKTGQHADDEGEGFLDLKAAYEKLSAQFLPGLPPLTAFLQRERLIDAEVADRGALRDRGVFSAEKDPGFRARQLSRDGEFVRLAATQPALFAKGAYRRALSRARTLSSTGIPSDKIDLYRALVAQETSLVEDMRGTLGLPRVSLGRTKEIFSERLPQLRETKAALREEYPGIARAASKPERQALLATMAVMGGLGAWLLGGAVWVTTGLVTVNLFHLVFGGMASTAAAAAAYAYFSRWRNGA